MVRRVLAFELKAYRLQGDTWPSVLPEELGSIPAADIMSRVRDLLKDEAVIQVVIGKARKNERRTEDTGGS